MYISYICIYTIYIHISHSGIIREFKDLGTLATSGVLYVGTKGIRGWKNDFNSDKRDQGCMQCCASKTRSKTNI